jgi:hypothetical protein
VALYRYQTEARPRDGLQGLVVPVSRVAAVVLIILSEGIAEITAALSIVSFAGPAAVRKANQVPPFAYVVFAVLTARTCQ